MNWTDKPEKPGWYWYEGHDLPSGDGTGSKEEPWIILVTEDGAKCEDIDMDIAQMCGRWCGPLIPPEYRS